MKHLTELQRLVLALDARLTDIPADKCVRQYHHQPQTFLEWLEKTPGGNNPIWYLSDAGYSRIVWDISNEDLFLTYNSTSRAKFYWPKAQAERDALVAFLKAEQTKLKDQTIPEPQTLTGFDTLLP